MFQICHNLWLLRSQTIKRFLYFVGAMCFPLFTYAEPPAPNTLPIPVSPDLSSIAVTGSASISDVVQNNVTGAVEQTVNQATQQAIINWQSFDIGGNATLNFKQPDVTSTTLNRILQGAPSQIFGNLNANGQIFLINNNGIVFGNGSQVNVGGLVSSTLDISDEAFANITAAINQGDPVFDGGSAANAEILVENGAEIRSADGGRIFMFAPVVTNNGTIATPGGQTILGGVDDVVYLYTPDNNEGIRGLLVELGTGGEVSNVGEVVAERGNITLIGQAVRQAGSLSATTTVQENGSIFLLAKDRALVSGTQGNFTVNSTRTGTVTIDEGSTTSILPDYASEQTAIDAATQDLSKVELLGKEIHFKSNSLVRATGGEVNATATNNPDPDKTGLIPNSQDDSRIYMEAGAVVDVSGDTTASVSVTRHQVTAEIRRNELADLPSQKDGPTQDEELQVDARVGTEIADVSAAINSIERSVEERLSVGGKVTFISDGDVILKSGSEVRFSGGQVNYQGGTIFESQLVLNDANVPISLADPNVIYSGLSSSLRAKNIASYAEGKDGGTFEITTNDAVIEGKITGETSQGRFQRYLASSSLGGENQPPKFSRNYSELPEASSFILNLENSISRDIQISQIQSSSLESLALSIDDALNIDHIVRIDADVINNSGVGNIELHTRGGFALEQNSNIDIPLGGKFSVKAGPIDIKSSIIAKSGTISLETNERVQTIVQSSPITIHSGARLDVSGNWINDFREQELGQTSTFTPVATHGGEVVLSAAGDVTLSQGSSILATGGAYLDTNRNLQAGQGGDITFKTNRPGFTTSLVLDGAYDSYALEKGGKLTIETNKVEINSTGIGSDTDTMYFADSFFSQRGFSKFDISSNRGGLVVDTTTRLVPKMKNLQLDSGFLTRTTGSNIKDFSKIVTKQDYLRNAVSVSLESNQSNIIDNTLKGIQNLIIEKGALLQTDIGGELSLSSDNSMIVAGTLSAPAGQINLTITDPKYQGDDAGFLDDQVLWLEDTARLLSTGAVLETPLPEIDGFSDFKVFDAGVIHLNANRGYIVGQEGSILDVSGASKTFRKFTPFGTSDVNYYADAGSIVIEGGDGVILNSTLLGSAADSRASNASLSFILKSLNTIRVPEPNPFNVKPRPQSDLIIELRNDNQAFSFQAGDAIPSDDFHGKALIGLNDISAGGFDNVSFSSRDLIAFKEDLSFSTRQSISFDSPNISLSNDLGNDFNVELNSQYVELGSTLSNNQNSNPIIQEGNGSINVNASLIDLVGSFGITGTSNINLYSAGDIRFRGVFDRENLPNGVFNFNGDLKLQANQIYPTTLSEYKINNQDTEDGAVEVVSSGNDSPVYSAGGKLEIISPTIINGGAIKAPGGNITLNASSLLRLLPGSLTSVSLEGIQVPFGRSEAGDWVYTAREGATSLTFVFDSPPDKSINLISDNIEFLEDAKIDTSGGGDYLAYEHIPGPNGSRDILNAIDFPDSFAIVPSLAAHYAPFDHAESADFSYQAGTEFILTENVNGLAAGRYSVLPARYAYLPGAFLVRPKSGFEGINRVISATDGSAIVGGLLAHAGGNVIDPITQGYSIISNSQLARFAEYSTTSANSYYVQQASITDSSVPSLPNDGGSVVFNAISNLSLLGNINSAGSNNARNGFVDIQAENIAIVGSESDVVDTGFLKLVVSALENIVSDSLLIGGTRERGADGTLVTTGANKLELKQGAKLTGNEILLAAKETITIEQGAVLEADGAKNLTSTNEKLLVQGDGALIRASSNNQVSISRSNVNDSAIGTIVIKESDANNESGLVTASNSILLDAANQISGADNVNVAGGSLNISSSKISIGEGISTSNGASVINSELLQSLGLNELVLTSATEIDLVDTSVLDISNLVLDGAHIRGFGSDNTVINATNFTLRNSGNRVTDPDNEGIGDGSLIVNSEAVTFASGEYLLNGFNNVNVNASKQLSYDGQQAELTFDGQSLVFDTPLVSGADAANFEIIAPNASTRFESQFGFDTINSVNNTIAANLKLTVKDLVFDTQFINHGSNFSVLSQDDVTFGENALIDVRGVLRDFIADNAIVPAGKVSITSTNGGFTSLSGSVLNISPGFYKPSSNVAVLGDAGTIEVSVPNDLFTFDGELIASVDFPEEVVVIDQGEYASADITAQTYADLLTFNAKLNAAEAFEKRYLRKRGLENGDEADIDIQISQGMLVKAKDVQLISDQGAIIVDSGGVIDASNENGGSIRLVAEDRVDILESAIVDAHSTAQVSGDGGDVKIEVSSLNGLINIAPNTIDVSAVGTGTHGEVYGRLRIDPSIQSTTDLSNRVSWSFAGPSSMNALEAYSVTESVTVLNQAAIENAYSRVTEYLNRNRNDLNVEANDFVLHGGVEFQADVITVGSEIDLAQLRDNGKPGVLTLRSVGNLEINNSISDGFVAADASNIIFSVLGIDVLQSNESWSYNFISGADLTSSDFLSTIDGIGDLLVNNDVVVRTGTGDISMVSGNSINLGNENTAIYTAGKNAGTGTIDPAALTRLNIYFQGAQFGRDGGDVYLDAKGDINAARNEQFISQWLFRLGDQLDVGDADKFPTIWGVNYNEFQQGVGALGGGDITVNAVGTISNLSTSQPTVAIHTGDAGLLNGPNISYTSNTFEQLGSGNLQVSAGKDILGGKFYVEKGSAKIYAQQNIGDINNMQSSTLIALGDAEIDLLAGDSLNVGAVVNAFLLPHSEEQRPVFGPAVFNIQESFFSTYTENSSLNATSLSGTINYSANAELINDQTLINATDLASSVLYAPGTVELKAFEGDISLNDNLNLTLLPSSKGGFKALAWDDILTPDGVTLILSDSDPNLLPNPLLTGRGLNDLAKRVSTQGNFLDTANAASIHAETPVHINDFENSVIVARNGSIDSKNNPLRLIFAEPVNIYAGKDIVGLNLSVQHNKDQDISRIQAGRNIRYPTARNSIGNVGTGNRATAIYVSGEGNLELIAGRDINFGTILGLSSVGNQFNPFLADKGADLLIMAGTALDKSFLRDLSANEFIDIINQFKTGELGNALLANGIAGVEPGGRSAISDTNTLSELENLEQRIANAITNFVEFETGIAAADTASAFSVFDQIAQEDKREVISNILFDFVRTSAELVTSGDEGLIAENYDLGFGVIERLFPQTELAAGNLTMVNSIIQTLEGGNIDIIVPGGQIDAGLPSAVGGDEAATSDEIGIVTQREGDINILSRGDVNVNRSRIFALGGGDIIFWSSLGSVDAGRGEKGALQIPPPTITFDENGNLVTQFPAAISGSGIRTASTNPNISPGDVVFGVPNGVVDAGDAGIDVGGNIVLAAEEVIGRDNFSVGGEVSGVQLSDSGPPIALTTQADSTSAGVSDSIQDSALGEAEQQADGSLGATALKWLEVFILGFGDDETASIQSNDCLRDDNKVCKG